ncbi:M13 family metallopeptidase [Kocuria sp.]|uniref:M13 family metallopeptidase n=1 Tax=Kocuria sp. TaxID=1871328 RepID=UPI0026DF6E42|nr:M13-type metalloendopeptidase [Kocuria sp.]MDO5618206.1 M13-type metalloendopeptidase [Kocuria sp.]
MNHDDGALTVLTPSTFDSAVRAQDDLFRHVNGPWLDSVEIPDDKPLTGAFMVLRDRAEEAVREIITGVEAGEPGSVESKVADLYASFMDEEGIESLGAAALRPDLEAVEAVNSVAQLQELFGTLLSRGIGSILGVDTDADPGDPTRNLVFVGQAGLGLPDEEYYREDSHAQIREQYRRHVQRMFEHAGFPDAADQAERVFDLETAIAAHHWDKVEVRDLTKMYNPFTWNDLKASTETFDWNAVVVTGLGLPESAVETVVNAQPSFFTGIGALLVADRVEQWKSWARWRVITGRAAYLSSVFVNEDFAFYGTVLSGTPELKERWKRGVGLVNGVLGEAVGKIYVERHYSPTAKERMDDLVANLLAAYRSSIETLDWMTDDTRAEALKKLAAFTPKIGYPEKWKDYSSLEIHADDLVGNIVRTSEFELGELIRKAGQPVEKHEWLMTPQTVNAYYHPLRNEIVFPAAILQPPFFDESAEDAVNYGAIGAVIGHEIGHGFDDKGSTADGEGRLRNWWTDADRSAFEDRTAKLVDQYHGLVPEQLAGAEDAPSVNGQMTLGENIGDLGGLSITYKAWEHSRGVADPVPASESVADTDPAAADPSAFSTTDNDGLTPAQKLFLSWAFVWQQKARDEAVAQRLAVDVHSPNEFRANQTARNIDAFHEAFGVTSSDQMWLAPEDRVRIW